MNHKLTCAVCGGTFYSQRRNTPVCSETCRRQYKKMKKAEMVKSNTSATPTKKRKSHIEEINAAARAAGMTYGKYKEPDIKSEDRNDKRTVKRGFRKA